MKLKKIFNFTISTLIFFGILFTYSKFGPSLPISVLSQTKGEPLVVFDTGKVTAVPDIAKVSFGITEQGQSLKQVQNSVDAKSKKLTASLKGLGIEEKDIKTTNYTVYPEYDYSGDLPVIIGYRVSTNYEVKIINFDTVNDALTLATQSGANVIGSISFDMNEETKKDLMNKAREEAVSLAKAKAESLAKASGITLGKIINVSENQESFPMAAYDKVPRAGGGIETANVTPGETEISVTVYLSYEVR